MDLGGSCANLLLWIEGARVEPRLGEWRGAGFEASDGNRFQPRLDFKSKHGYHFGAANHSPQEPELSVRHEKAVVRLEGPGAAEAARLTRVLGTGTLARGVPVAVYVPHRDDQGPVICGGDEVATDDKSSAR